MPDYQAETSVNVYISVPELAKMFSQLDCEEMADFWQSLAWETDKWDRAAAFQWQMMRDNLDKQKPDFDGLRVLRSIAEYSE